jgi:hypothetical protein
MFFFCARVTTIVPNDQQANTRLSTNLHHAKKQSGDLDDEKRKKDLL